MKVIRLNKSIERNENMSIREIAKTNEHIHYLGVCIRKLKDDKFRKEVLKLYNTPDAIFFNHLGISNADKNIYLIYCNNAARGFFSLFNLVLDGLYFADYYHLTPVVEYGRSTLYDEENGINGVLNSFEYYFKQPCNVSVADARNSQNVAFYEYNHRKLGISNFNITIANSLDNPEEMDAYITSRAALIQKYIKFSNQVQDYMNDRVEPLFAEYNVLGVHVRGTDFNMGYKGHAVAVTPREYLEETQNAFRKGKFEKVFLATDEVSVIKMYEKAFGSCLIYHKDILRSQSGTALHFSGNSRKNHKYLLGLEVLRDMYSLSKCDGLVAGMSNVSLTARIMKRSNGEEYNFLNMINHGFNTTNKRMKTTK